MVTFLRPRIRSVVKKSVNRWHTEVDGYGEIGGKRTIRSVHELLTDAPKVDQYEADSEAEILLELLKERAQSCEAHNWVTISKDYSNRSVERELHILENFLKKQTKRLTKGDPYLAQLIRPYISSSHDEINRIRFDQDRDVSTCIRYIYKCRDNFEILFMLNCPVESVSLVVKNLLGQSALDKADSDLLNVCATHILNAARSV